MADFKLSTHIEGYPLIYVDRDGNVLCRNCAEEDLNSEDGLIESAQGQIYWQGETLKCDGCNCDLESAYGVPEKE